MTDINPEDDRIRRQSHARARAQASIEHALASERLGIDEASSETEEEAARAQYRIIGSVIEQGKYQEALALMLYGSSECLETLVAYNEGALALRRSQAAASGLGSMGAFERPGEN